MSLLQWSSTENRTSWVGLSTSTIKQKIPLERNKPEMVFVCVCVCVCVIMVVAVVVVCVIMVVCACVCVKEGFMSHGVLSWLQPQVNLGEIVANSSFQILSTFWANSHVRELSWNIRPLPHCRREACRVVWCPFSEWCVPNLKKSQTIFFESWTQKMLLKPRNARWRMCGVFLVARKELWMQQQILIPVFHSVVSGKKS